MSTFGVDKARTQIVRALVATVALTAVCMIAPTPARGANTSPGMNSAFASTGGVPLTPGGPKLAVTLTSGKSKRVLVVDVTMRTFSPSLTSDPNFVLSVNGIVGIMEPQASSPPGTGSGYDDVCHAPPGFTGTDCLLTARSWLDLDAAEASLPGTFIRKPLVVELFADDCLPMCGLGTATNITLSVEMVKK
jgi:hypothetical protein